MGGLYSTLKTRFLPTWRQGFNLAWPVIIEKILRTLMRTTDTIVAGFFSPAAIAAVGLADIFSGLLTRVGLSVGDSTIALSSQDTGSRAIENRDEVITQAFIIGFLTGLPFIIFGLFFSYTAIALLGAEERVIRIAGIYLSIIMIKAPITHLTYIGARTLQGIGQTQQPMYINGVANILNILLTITLAFGCGSIPQLSVAGIALATTIGESVASILFILSVYQSSEIGFKRPSDFVITRQLIVISIPRFMEGLTETLAQFPFNAILLIFGTEVNAAYHIGRRIYRQVANPVIKGYDVAANILVGQSLGQEEYESAYSSGIAMGLLGLISVGMLSIVLFIGADLFVQIFTNHQLTRTYSVRFVWTYSIAVLFIAVFKILAGSVRGGSETRAPFAATSFGIIVFLLGISYTGGFILELGVIAVYLSLICDYAWRASFLGIIYYRRNWIGYGKSLMADRDSIPSDS